jgi:chitodextrinase
MAMTCALTAIVLVGTAGVAHAAPRDTTPPTAPTNLRTTSVTETAVTLAWHPSTDNVGVIEYAAWTTEIPTVRVPGSQTSATVTGLHPNTSYLFRVQAWDGRNWSWQAELTVTTARELVPPTAPGAPMVTNTVDEVTASSAALVWPSSTDNFGPVRYEVLVDGVPTPNAMSLLPPGTPSGPTAGAQVRQLRPGTTYQLAVRARDGSGNVSAVSDTVTVTTDQGPPDMTAPTAPTLLHADAGGTSYCPEELWLRWSPATDDTEPPSGIEYEIRVNGTIIEVAPGATRWVTYTDVRGQNTVTIVAVDRAGNASSPSNPITRNIDWGTHCPS